MMRGRRAPWGLICVAAMFVAIGGAPAASAGNGISARTIAADLDQPVGFTFDPRGRIWYVGKASGEVRILNLERDTDRLFHRFSGVSSLGERGALGVALHPDYPRRPFAYVFVTRGPGDRPLENQIVRLRDDDGRARRPRVIFRSPTTARSNHNGGRILFGPDGMLYAVVGDGGADQGTAQDLDDVRGKVLRMTPTGGVPVDNPFGTLVFSYGLRNSFGFDFDPQTGDLWETENGPDCNDELNRIQPGANYAWGPSFDCGSAPPPLDTNADGPTPRVLPLEFFTPTIAPTGLAFCDGCALGPAAEGTFFFGTAKGATLYQVSLNGSRDDIAGIDPTIRDAGRIVSVEVAPGGSIYFSDLAGRIFRLVRT
jgi:glucose/arabinose dehydrogenase